MSREYTKRIPLLVVGGGIGGLAAALAVAGAGRAVHVIEKSPEFGEIGEPRARAASDKDTVRLFIGAGRRGGIRPGDLVGAIAGETGVPASAIGAIEIADSYSLVSVPEEFVEQLIAGMKEATLRGQKVTIRASASGRASIFEVSVASAHRASRRARRQATAVGPGRSDCSRRDTRQG